MKKRTNFFRIVYLLSDALLIAFSYYFAEWLWMSRFAKSGNFLMHENMRGYVIAAVTAYAAVALIIFSVVGLYRSFRYKSIWNIWLKNTVIHATLVGVIMGVLYVFRIQDVSRGVLLLFFITVSLLSFLKHLLAVGMLRIIRVGGYNQKHVIVVGDGQLAVDYARTVRENRRFGITVDGYLADSEDQTAAGEIGTYFGSYDALEKRIRNHGVDEVIIALEQPDTNKVFSVIECCEKSGTRVSVIPYYNYMISAVPSVNSVGSMKCFELRTSPLDDALNRAIKRVFDVVFSFVVLLLLSPLLLVVALGVKLSSPGPVFFKQERVGKDKKPFTMYKFRSMKVNVESDTAWSKDVDPRKTRFGSFIRKLSIDELPQFFNVLKGDMSVIGPRPEIPHYVEQFRETIPKYMLKHLVRPGITGWAQVNGYRGDTSIEERIKCDIWYIENWTVGLDVKIMFRTVFGGMINSEKTNQQG